MAHASAVVLPSRTLGARRVHSASPHASCEGQNRDRDRSQPLGRVLHEPTGGLRKTAVFGPLSDTCKHMARLVRLSSIPEGAGGVKRVTGVEHMSYWVDGDLAGGSSTGPCAASIRLAARRSSREAADSDPVGSPEFIWSV